MHNVNEALYSNINERTLSQQTEATFKKAKIKPTTALRHSVPMVPRFCAPNAQCYTTPRFQPNSQISSRTWFKKSSIPKVTLSDEAPIASRTRSKQPQAKTSKRIAAATKLKSIISNFDIARASQHAIASDVLDPETGQMMEYRHLIKQKNPKNQKNM